MPPRGRRSDGVVGRQLLVGPSSLLTRLDALLGHCTAVQEAMALVACLHDVAMVRGRSMRNRFVAMRPALPWAFYCSSALTRSTVE